MLVTPQFIFIHMPKAGGNFVRAACTGVEVGTFHAGGADIPPEYRHLPVFAVVRNPWDWYVSWYHFERALPRANVAYMKLTEHGKLGFSETVERACAWKPHGDLYSILFWTLVGQFEGIEVGRFENLREDFRAFCERHGVEVDVSGAKLNQSSRGPYQDYYSPELRELVAQSAHRLIDRYGYAFEDPLVPSSAAGGSST
jgi:hypothetical protein